MTAPSVLIAAIGLAREHGGAAEALRASGLDLDGAERFQGVSDDLRALLADAAGTSVDEALALGFLAGRMAQRPRPRRSFDPTWFVVDRDLSVAAAHGESVLRLPWVDEELFVGRQLPDLVEMPGHVRTLMVRHYGMGLDSERTRFSFESYGHRYTVECVPVAGEGGVTERVLGVATPAYPSARRLRSALSFERAAESHGVSARNAETRARLYQEAGDTETAERELEVAEQARKEAQRARLQAARLRSNR